MSASSLTVFGRAWWYAAARLTRAPVSLTLAAPWVLATACLLAAGLWGLGALRALAADTPDLQALLERENLFAWADGLGRLARFGAPLCAVLAALAFHRRRWTLYLLRQACVAAGLAACLYGCQICSVWGLIREQKIGMDGVEPEEFVAYYWQFKQILPAALILALCAVAWLVSFRRRTLAFYGGAREAGPSAADGVIELFFTTLRQPFTRSLSASVGVHACVLLLPLLLMLLRTVVPYGIPYGRGLPDAGGGAKFSQKGTGGSDPTRRKASGKTKAGAKGNGQKKEKLEIKLSEKPGTGRISFVFPDGKGRGPSLLREGDLQKFDQETQDEYAPATMTIIAGGRGSGTGGGFGPGNKPGGVGRGGVGPGGFPEGVRGGMVRFIRLQYKGEDWEDGMDEVERADINFLEFFQGEIGWKVAKKGESHVIRLLRDYPRGRAPPFVFMTGAGKIEVTPAERNVLRAYLLDGGMLFADCGSARWDRSFRQFIATVFPEKALVDVPDDDLIFRHPYRFTNGAPPLWHHGGFRALGIRHQNRWLVFYHPGDMNDAWKSGHSDMDREMAERALQLGVNVVYYAFCHYLDATRKYRK
jgi:hypothetical protein